MCTCQKRNATSFISQYIFFGNRHTAGKPERIERKKIAGATTTYTDDGIFTVVIK